MIAAGVKDVVRERFRSYTELLRTTLGDFSITTESCLLENGHSTSLSDPAVPAAGQGFWYLQRAVLSVAGSTGSYDEPGSFRDAGIAASPNACQ
jgi:hypothetical protein